MTEKMMTDETAKELAAAMRELSAALNALPRSMGAIMVQHSHSGLNGGAQNYWPQQYPLHNQWQQAVANSWNSGAK